MRKALVVLLTLVASAAPTATAFAQKPDPSAAEPKAPTASQVSNLLQEGLRTTAIFKHLGAFQGFADNHGDTRTSGTKGYDQSASYVVKQLKTYGFDVERQKFDFDAFFQDALSAFEQTAPTPTTYVEDTEFTTMEFSGSGDVTAELIAVDLTLPPSAEAQLEQRLRGGRLPGKRERRGSR